jgi:hypothetical protein
MTMPVRELADFADAVAYLLDGEAKAMNPNQ